MVTTDAAEVPASETESRPLRRAVVASSLGTVFEFYDFYLYGSLAAIIALKFFSALEPGLAFIAALLAFAAGFVVRPFGALVFGSLGDRIGRKYSFLVTLIIMGTSTFLVGCLPDYDTIGLWAPAFLVLLRMLQGLALGGEYGGAVTYVAEHTETHRRGFVTSWIQTTGSIGLLLSLFVIMACRYFFGSAFEDWAWRVPFLLSGILLVISIYIRLQLEESPVFTRMKAKGQLSRSPAREVFGKWTNVRLVILTIFGGTLGPAMLIYAGQIYALYFLTVTLKVEDIAANLLLAAGLIIGTPLCILFGSLSDRVGRKPVILTGCLLGAVALFPIFSGLTHFANPALARAMDGSPVRLHVNEAECSFQFDPIGKAEFRSGCDIARAALARQGVSYALIAEPGATEARIAIGDQQIPVFDGRQLSAQDFATQLSGFRDRLKSALVGAGYPSKADPSAVNYPALALLLAALVGIGSLVYGPLAAWLVELFPSRIRYTSISLPYHIGNGWFGGFLPTIAFAVVTTTGNIYSGLWYPVIGCALCAVVGFLFLPETLGRPLDDRPTDHPVPSE
jgi:MFS family permease